MKHTISILVENHAGVLARISGLFARRGYNINSLAVGVTDTDAVSRITIVVEGSEYTLEQIEKQLNKLIDVIKVRTVGGEELLERELVMIKVCCTPQQRSELITIAELSKAKIADTSLDTMTLELSADEDGIRSLEALLKPYGIRETVRTGKIALQKGGSALRI